MNWMSDAFKEVATNVSKESSVLSRESFKSMESMNISIGAQSANSIAAVAREFGDLILFDDKTSSKTSDSVTKRELANPTRTLHQQADSTATVVPETGSNIGAFISSIGIAKEQVAMAQNKEREATGSSSVGHFEINAGVQHAAGFDSLFKYDRFANMQEGAMSENANSGITDLIQVTQLKDSNANEAALSRSDLYDGAFSSIFRDDNRVWETEFVGPIEVDSAEHYSDSSAEQSPYLQAWGGAFGNFDLPVAAHKMKVASSFSWSKADEQVQVDRLKPITAEWWEDQSIGSMEIQQLMSNFNQAETLASNVIKKQEETTDSIIHKI